jgi:hypothetical protein
MMFQMMLCGECYENIYTSRRTNYPSFNTSPHSIIWNTFVKLFLKHPVHVKVRYFQKVLDE